MINRLLVSIGLVVASLVATTAQAAEPTELAKLSYEFGYALDGGVYYFATVENNGADATIIIYDNDFSVKEQFTLKGVNSYATGSDGREQQISGVVNCNGDIGSPMLSEDIIATRGLFTKDNKWVVVAYNSKKDEDGNYTYDPAYTDLFVYSADNKKICELPANMENGHNSGVGIICLSNRVSGKPYYVTKDDSSYSCIIWSFADVNGVITPRAVASSVKASPNPLPAGATLNIDLESEADDNTILTIIDMDGRQVYRKRVRPGEVSVQVPTKFSRGVYIYTVIYGDGESYSGKVAAE